MIAEVVKIKKKKRKRDRRKGMRPQHQKLAPVHWGLGSKLDHV